MGANLAVRGESTVMRCAHARAIARGQREALASQSCRPENEVTASGDLGIVEGGCDAWALGERASESGGEEKVSKRHLGCNRGNEALEACTPTAETPKQRREIPIIPHKHLPEDHHV